MNGSASIKGPTGNLIIKVDAESAKGTDIKIPINDAEAVEESNYIRFKTPEEKKGKANTNGAQPTNYNGLELEFDFAIVQGFYSLIQ